MAFCKAKNILKMLNWLLAKKLVDIIVNHLNYPIGARNPFIFATIHTVQNLCLTKNDPKSGM